MKRRPGLARIAAAGLALLLVLLAGLVRAQADHDRIPRFAAEIEIRENGDLIVTEEIDFLVSPGSEKRGIFRDFPTTYRNELGMTETVGFELLEVERDGLSEAHVVETHRAGVRIRIGQVNVFLREGVHRYRIIYRTDRQLLFLEDVDELYWNVTGNDWAHPIDRAEAIVRLPGGAAPVDSAGYTGRRGATSGDYTESRQPDGSVVFATTRRLDPGEGFTIAVSWPKGIVAAPSPEEEFQRRLDQNLGLLVGLAGFCLTLGYFLLQWFRVGRDPAAGIIVPLYEAPDGLSPAATGLLWVKIRGESIGRAKVFAVALTSLAIKKRLTIEQENETFNLTATPLHGKKGKQAGRLPSGEAAAMKALFPSGRGTVRIKRSYTPSIANAVRDVCAALDREHSAAYFRYNAGTWFLGAAIALAGVAGSLTLQAGDFEFLFAVMIGAIFVFGFSVPVFLMGRKLVPLWLAVFAGEPRHLAACIAGTAFLAPFTIPLIGSQVFIYDLFGPVMMMLVIGQLAMVLLFFRLLQKPTLLGRRMLDRIEGYRLYLSVAEADRLNMLTAEPEMTLELFEHHLPYAMALGVEEAWSARFTAGASAAVRQAVERSPNWYRSHRSRSNYTTVATSLAIGLSSTLTTAATKPSSSGSGGSSGGGSSGGGGGGGGGGSW